MLPDLPQTGWPEPPHTCAPREGAQGTRPGPRELGCLLSQQRRHLSEGARRWGVVLARLASRWGGGWSGPHLSELLTP